MSYRIFIGYDPREAIAYHACVQSIIETCSDPLKLSFHPVTGPLRDGSNAFTYARFLVPHLCHFQGAAVFLDGDMIVRSDIAELFEYPIAGRGVRVVPHDYRTRHPVKYLGNKNEDYPRKNWSSVMLWNCGFFHNHVLTPEYVSQQSGAFLHRLGWLREEHIDYLPAEWNRLVLEQPLSAHDKLRHFTIGTPCFSEYADCEGAEEWHDTLGRLLAPLSR